MNVFQKITKSLISRLYPNKVELVNYTVMKNNGDLVKTEVNRQIIDCVITSVLNGYNLPQNVLVGDTVIRFAWDKDISVDKDSQFIINGIVYNVNYIKTVGLLQGEPTLYEVYVR